VAYKNPKDILNAFMAALRADTGTVLAACTKRKGPQHTVRLATGATAANGVQDVGVVFVALDNLQGGETPAGSGNTWWHVWTFAVNLAVPDDESDPETAEDLRLDLLSDFMEFMHSNRCCFAAMTGHIASAKCVLMSMSAEDQQVWRGVEVTVTYKALRS
jgi:hypothetical protein